jgi:hypothetical protein
VRHTGRKLRPASSAASGTLSAAGAGRVAPVSPGGEAPPSSKRRGLDVRRRGVEAAPAAEGVIRRSDIARPLRAVSGIGGSRTGRPSPHRRRCHRLRRHGAAWQPEGASAQPDRDNMNTRIKLAPYLTGTLWHLRAEDRTFILFNSLPIARRDPDEEDWTVIAPNWRVANAGSGKSSVKLQPWRGRVDRQAASERAGQIPPSLVGRQLSGDEAVDLLTTLRIGSKREPVVLVNYQKDPPTRGSESRA